MLLLFHIVYRGDIHFCSRTKEEAKSNKITPRKKVALELLEHILGNRSTRSLMAGNTAIFGQDIELRTDPYPFFTTFQISSMNQKTRFKNTFKIKAPFKWVLLTLFQQHPVKLIFLIIF